MPAWECEAEQLEHWAERVKHHQWQQNEHGYWWGGAYDGGKAQAAKRLETLADRVWECYAGGATKGGRCQMILEEYNVAWQKYLARA